MTTDVVSEIEDVISNTITMSDDDLYLLLSRAQGEIERLRKRNVELGFSENPDRSGGQFTDEELNRCGWL